MIIKSLIWIKSARSEWQTRLIFRRSKRQIYRTIVRWPTVICSLGILNSMIITVTGILVQLFPSVNHPNQFLYVYLDVKFASSKHHSCLFFGSFRIHEGNNYVYLSRYYLRGSCHSPSAMFLRHFYYFVFYMKSLTIIFLQLCIAKTL